MPRWLIAATVFLVALTYPLAGSAQEPEPAQAQAEAGAETRPKVRARVRAKAKGEDIPWRR